MTGIDVRLAAVFAAAGRAFGVSVDERFAALAGEPLAWFEQHVHWPSRFTASGMPVELSLKLRPGTPPALRCVVDVADHRAGHAANWDRYRSAAELATGLAQPALVEICAPQLAGVPDSFATPLVIGLGFAADGRTRGSLYFRTAWMERAELERRVPDVAAALAEAAERHGSPTAGPLEVLAYDVEPRRPVRWKAYTWPALEDSFEATVGRHPDLAPARGLFGASAHPRPLMLQVSPERQRLFLFTAAWGESLLPDAAARLGLSLAPLETLRALALEHEIELTAPLVAVGAEDGTPSLTVYLWPGDRRAATPIAPPPAAELPDTGPAGALLAAIERGAESIGELVPLFFAVVDTQREDGAWTADRAEQCLAAWHATHALRAYAATPFAGVGAAPQALRHAFERTREHLATLAVGRDDATTIAAWLGAWVCAGGRPADPRAERARAALGQGDDGVSPTVAGALRVVAHAEARP